MESNRHAHDGGFFSIQINEDHPLLNGTKQTGIRWGIFLDENHPLLNGIKQTSTRWGAFFNINKLYGM